MQLIRAVYLRRLLQLLAYCLCLFFSVLVSELAAAGAIGVAVIVIVAVTVIGAPVALTVIIEVNSVCVAATPSANIVPNPGV